MPGRECDGIPDLEVLDVDTRRDQNEIAVDRSQLDVRQNGRWLREDSPVVLSVGLDAANTSPVG